MPILILLSMSALVSSSCSVFRFSSPLKRQWSSPEEILKEYSANYKKLITFKAEGRLSVQSSEFNESGTIFVTVKMPDSLRIRVEGPMGVDVAHFFLDSQKYLLYLNRDEVVYQGLSDTLNVKRLLTDLIGITLKGNSVDFRDVQSELIGLFTGATPIDNLDLEPVNFTDSTKTVNLFRMSGLSGDILYEFPINNEFLQKVQIFDDNNRNRIEKSFSRYTYRNNVFFPRRILYTFLEERGRISLTYFNYQINRSIKSDEFHIDIPQELLNDSSQVNKYRE